MSNYMFELIICGTAYVVLVYFMVKLLKIRNKNTGEDDGEGGIIVSPPTGKDSPTGNGLPDFGPIKKIKREEPEEMLV